MTKTYLRYDLMGEKILWLTIWDQHIRQLTSGQAQALALYLERRSSLGE